METTPRRRLAFAGAALALLALPATIAFAGGPTAEKMRHHFGGPKSEEDVREHLDERADRLLERVSATEEQRAAVDGILDDLAPELYARRTAARDLRKDLRAELTAETIDRAALEDLRAEGIALADEGSRAVMNALADLAEVLTPEQRAQIGEAIDRQHEEGPPSEAPGRGPRR